MSTAKLYESGRGHLSTMSDEEWIRINDEMVEAYKLGNRQKADELSCLLPISLEAGLSILKFCGREGLEDCNTKDIEALYGSDWIERYGEETLQETFSSR